MGLLRVLPRQVLSVSNAQVPKASLSPCSSTMKKKPHKRLHPHSISHFSLKLLLVLLLGTSEKSLEPPSPSPSFSYAKAAHRSVISPSPLQAEGSQVSQAPFTGQALTISVAFPYTCSSSSAPLLHWGPQAMRQLHSIYAGTQLEESPCM